MLMVSLGGQGELDRAGAELWLDGPPEVWLEGWMEGPPDGPVLGWSEGWADGSPEAPADGVPDPETSSFPWHCEQ